MASQSLGNLDPGSSNSNSDVNNIGDALKEIRRELELLPKLIQQAQSSGVNPANLTQRYTQAQASYLNYQQVAASQAKDVLNNPAVDDIIKRKVEKFLGSESRAAVRSNDRSNVNSILQGQGTTTVNNPMQQVLDEHRDTIKNHKEQTHKTHHLDFSDVGGYLSLAQSLRSGSLLSSAGNSAFKTGFQSESKFQNVVSGIRGATAGDVTGLNLKQAFYGGAIGVKSQQLTVGFPNVRISKTLLQGEEAAAHFNSYKSFLTSGVGSNLSGLSSSVASGLGSLTTWAAANSGLIAAGGALYVANEARKIAQEAWLSHTGEFFDWSTAGTRYIAAQNSRTNIYNQRFGFQLSHLDTSKADPEYRRVMGNYNSSAGVIGTINNDKWSSKVWYWQVGDVNTLEQKIASIDLTARDLKQRLGFDIKDLGITWENAEFNTYTEWYDKLYSKTIGKITGSADIAIANTAANMVQEAAAKYLSDNETLKDVKTMEVVQRVQFYENINHLKAVENFQYIKGLDWNRY